MVLRVPRDAHGGDHDPHWKVLLYANYQGLERDPFPNRPSPDVFFDSSVHRGAWSFLRGSVKADEPFIMLVGDFGTGKTLLALKLVEALSSKNVGACVYISTPAQSYLEVLRRGYRALGLGEASEVLNTDRLLDRIYTYFETEETARRLFLVVEDPQDLDPETLHRIRLLPNYNVDGRYPICLVMFAHTSFPRMLKQSRWQALDQRIKLRYHITGFDRAETREYVYFRLLRAQGQSVDPFLPYFEEAAIDRIYDLTGGVPRDINNICGMCLTLGGSRRRVAISTDLVNEAGHLLGRDAAQKRAIEAGEDDAPARAARAAAGRPAGETDASAHATTPTVGAWPPGADGTDAPAPRARSSYPPHSGAAPGVTPAQSGVAWAGAGPAGWPAAGYAAQTTAPGPSMPGYAPGAWGADRSAADPASHAHEGLGGSDGDRPVSGGFRARFGNTESLSGTSGKGNLIWWSAVGVFVVLILIAVITRNFDLTASLG